MNFNPLLVRFMENNIASLGVSTAFAAPKAGGTGSANQQPSPVNELLAPSSTGAVERSRDVPVTSQVPEVNNQPEVRVNRTDRAEERTDPVAQQRQIESFLAEQTGEDPEAFQGIDIQTALDLQESFRDRPTGNEPTTVALAPQNSQPQNSEQPVDANDQQTQALQQRLQSRLAEQIPNDPGTEFPQLIETVA